MAVSKIGTDFIPYTQLNTNIFYQRKNGIAYVRTTSAGVEITRNGVVLGTMPVGMRPAAQSDFAGTALGGTESVFFRVDTNGNVTGYANPTTKYWSGTFAYVIAN